MNLPSSFLSVNLAATALIAAMAASAAFFPVASTEAAAVDLAVAVPELSWPLASASSEPGMQARRLAAQCAACGVIESTRELAGASLAGASALVSSREITIRMRDGSMRVFTDSNSASWRYGERVSVIAGSI